MDQPGTNTNGEADQGKIGEHLVLTLDVSKALLMTSGVPISFLQTQLPAGDYFAQVSAAYHSPNGQTTPSDVKQGASPLPAQFDVMGSWSYDYVMVQVPDDPVYPSPVHRIKFGQEGGTIYAVSMAEFTGGQLLVYGAMRIWRRR